MQCVVLMLQQMHTVHFKIFLQQMPKYVVMMLQHMHTVRCNHRIANKCIQCVVMMLQQMYIVRLTNAQSAL